MKNRIAVDDKFGDDESQQRLEKILRGAFAGAPTPLKDIPKQSGVTRAPRSKKDDQERC
jgi:hypothetical protein